MSTILSFVSLSPSQTRRIASSFAKKLIRTAKRRPIIIALKGNLGSGKTTFVQGFGQGLGVKEKILSPTFILIKVFQIPRERGRAKEFIHIDCYRISKPRELFHLGVNAFFSDPHAIVLIEWAEKIRKYLPWHTLWIHFEPTSSSKREITVFIPKHKT